MDRSLVLLTTKISPPVLRTKFVHRSLLLSYLNQSLWDRNRVTLISAQAGAGKTTLLVEWLQTLTIPTAWLSLDTEDNDFSRFLAYLTKALQQLAITITFPLPLSIDSLDTQIIDQFGALLVNEIAALPKPALLVLDDLHLLTASAPLRLIQFLIDHMPANLHIVLASREIPALSLTHLRMHKLLSELRGPDLAFTEDETEEYFNRIMQMNLPKNIIRTLTDFTEGWIMGLQLYGLLYKPHRTPLVAANPIKPNNHLLHQYLAKEIFNHLSSKIQQFLLDTCLLKIITADLAQAVTGLPECQEILNELEDTNLFLIQLDPERRWFRYHHLFADYLIVRLEKTRPERIKIIHQRASDWFMQQGWLEEAIHHAALAQQWEIAAKLLANIHLSDMLQLGESRIISWLDAFPPGLVDGNVKLLMLHAWADIFLADPIKAEKYSMKAEVLLASGNNPISAETCEQVQGEIEAIRAFVAIWRRDPVLAIDRAGHALKYLGKEQFEIRATVNNILGTAYFLQDQLSKTIQTYNQAVGESYAAGAKRLTCCLNADLAWGYVMIGRYHIAEEICRTILKEESEGMQTQYPRIVSLILLGKILYEWNHLNPAKVVFTQSIKLIEEAGYRIIISEEILTLAKVYVALNKPAKAIDFLTKITATISPDEAYLLRKIQAQQALIHLQFGDQNLAAEWAQKTEQALDKVVRSHTMPIYLDLVRIYLAHPSFNTDTQKLMDCQNLLFLCLEVAQKSDNRRHLAEILMLQSQLYDILGRKDDSISVLKPAVRYAASESYIRLFLDEGPVMENLLMEISQQGTESRFLTKLFKAFKRQTRFYYEDSPVSTKARVENLSKRELEILFHLEKGESNLEIATELHLSENTVKRHVSNILDKLKVASRRQAIRKILNT